MARGKEETSNSESTLPRLGREVEGPNCRSEADDNELKEKHDDLENVDVADIRFDVNKDVVDGMLVDEVESSPEEDEVESSPEEDARKTAEAEKRDANPDDVVDAKDVE
ncbi:hypothetical protein DEO72_LG5g1701 [Vigna unguiculata]|uniref:Uncharacterized protein n=1 Tax=Vigna unguiculata TaxID=3917 RepID=A0A4D6LY11_VIGUN|nr:hypothetical protein DEO72_LG5g1701 [Vigna unguiculata]